MSRLADDDPCACGHARDDHEPTGCRVCDCPERSPFVITREDGSTYEAWRRPFEKGHELSVRHGATSPRLTSERAAVVLRQLQSEFPWVGDADGIVVDALCRALAVLDPLDRYVLDVIEGRAEAYPRKGAPRTGVEAVPPHVYEQWSRTHRAVLDAASRLGMTPTDRARLFKDAGWAKRLAVQQLEESLAPLRATGAELLARRRAALGRGT